MKFGQRWYNPADGRLTQQDTLDAPLDPANADRYAYAADDPINNLDPSGRGLLQFITAGAVRILAAAVFSLPPLNPVIGGDIGGCVATAVERLLDQESLVSAVIYCAAGGALGALGVSAGALAARIAARLGIGE